MKKIVAPPGGRIHNNRMKNYFLTTFLLLSFSFVFSQQSSFRAAAVKVNITPSVPKQLLGYAATIHGCARQYLSPYCCAR